MRNTAGVFFLPLGMLLGKSLARLSGDSVKRDVGPNLVGC